MATVSHFAAFELKRLVAADQLRKTEVSDLDVVRRVHWQTQHRRQMKLSASRSV